MPQVYPGIGLYAVETFAGDHDDVTSAATED